jgi:hypothetical protein
LFLPNCSLWLLMICKGTLPSLWFPCVTLHNHLCVSSLSNCTNDILGRREEVFTLPRVKDYMIPLNIRHDHYYIRYIILHIFFFFLFLL